MTQYGRQNASNTPGETQLSVLWTSHGLKSGELFLVLGLKYSRASYLTTGKKFCVLKILIWDQRMAETQCFKDVVIATGDSVTVYKP